MRIPLKASISAAFAVAVLAVAAATSLATGGAEQAPITLPPEPGSVVHDVDGGLGMCIAPAEGATGPDAPVCDDVVVNPAPDTGPQIVEPRPGMADVRARPFDSASVDADGVTATIDFVSGVEPCYVLDHVDAVETPDEVTITLYEGHDPAAGDAVCIEIGVFKRTIVTLGAPLGDREIVDGAA